MGAEEAPGIVHPGEVQSAASCKPGTMAADPLWRMGLGHNSRLSREARGVLVLA